MKIEFRGGIFFLELVEYMNFTVRGSGALPLRTLTRTFEIAACLCVRRPSRLLPASGVRISHFLPACARRKQAQHVSCPSRTRGFVFQSYRCAPPPDALGNACVSPAMLTGACPQQGRARLPQRQATSPSSASIYSSQTFCSRLTSWYYFSCCFWRSLCVRSFCLVSCPRLSASRNVRILY